MLPGSLTFAAGVVLSCWYVSLGGPAATYQKMVESVCANTHDELQQTNEFELLLE